MNLLNRIMSYDKTRLNQENCNCDKCVSTDIVTSENQIVEYPKLSEEEIEQIINERYSDKDDKTKTFIRKALRKHGDRYDYSNVEYIKNHEKVKIICKIEEHKLFLQTPHNHLRGSGCPKCRYIKSSNKRRMSIDEFIKRAKKIHGDKYNYSKTKYIDSKTEVIITCSIHGDFQQTPNSHLNGNGCPMCSGNKKLTTEEFIEKSNEIHGKGTYDYSKVNYINYEVKVIIICKKHGEFKQTPRDHLCHHGCPNCAKEYISQCNKLTLKEFIKRAKEIHGCEYDYSKVEYVDSKTKITIICPIHGEFEQIPSHHLQGGGCSACRKNKKLTTELFIKQAKKIHKEINYDYSKVEYINAHTKVEIICPIKNHGSYMQTPANHLKGQGCPICKGGINSTTENFIEKANKKHGIGTYNYSKVKYTNAYTKVEIICPKHGNYWQIPNVHLQGCGCPKCNKNKGEDDIRNFLTKKGIEFEEQKSFEGCKYKKPLRFDFYLPKYNLCIESDGEPHFQKINWNGKWTDEEMEEKLKLNQHRDNIKNEYCKNNGITLLRVNNLKAVDELIEYFKLMNLTF